MAQYLCIWVVSYWFSATLISKWPPGGHVIFLVSGLLTLVWLWISTPNFSGTVIMYMGSSLLIFSNVNFKMATWQPYWIVWFSVSGLCRQHGFGSVNQFCFGISVSNFMCMSFVAVGNSLMIYSYVPFTVASLWFWTMFNCNPPIAPCYPILWGGYPSRSLICYF